MKRLVTLVLIFINSYTVIAQDKTQDPAPRLKILSWNIYMLPSFVYASTDKKARAEGIIEVLNQSDYDIIVFQEAFHKVSRKRLWKGLNENFPYQYGPANRVAISFKANSGIWILSKIPLQYVHEIKYNECEGDGCLARKGVLMVEGEMNGNRFQILGTHNNGGETNFSQFNQLRNELLEPYRKEGVPQIICGDFNTKKGSRNNLWEHMIKQFSADTSFTQYDDRSEDHKNTFPINDLYERMPDFIFVNRNGCEKIQIERISTLSFGPTFVQGPSKKVFGETVGLSDHYPVQATISWKKGNENKGTP